MNDVLNWIYIIGFVLLAGFVIYLFGAVPMMINQKKMIGAYRKLASLYGFEIKNDKIKLIPNWPTIKGFFNKKYFIVTQARYGKNTSFYNSSTGTWRTFSNYITKISTKLWNPVCGDFKMVNSSIFKKTYNVEEFEDSVCIDGTSAEQVKNLLNDNIKQEIIDVLNKGGILHIEVKNGILFASNFHGLVNDNDVEECSKRIKLLCELSYLLDLKKPQ
ncbi:MAG TPA: hypothetical protein PKN32_02720 [Bacteroidales bacterium]|nr:hypothetical protein [Bacteroidales bacterium]